MRSDCPTTCIVILAILSISILPLFDPFEASALPEGYPVWLSGGYAVEQPNSTMYLDYLQPGSTENYLVHLFNTGPDQVRYRVSLTDEPEDWLVFLGSGVDEMIVDLDPGTGTAVDLNMKTPTERTGDIEVTVKDESSMEEWQVTLRIICRKGPLVVSLPVLDHTLGRNTPALVDIDLRNLENTVLNVTLNMDGIPASDARIEGEWTVVFEDRSLELPPDSTTRVRAYVYAPELEPVGSQKVTTLSVVVDGITRPFTVTSINFKVQTIFDLRSTVFPAEYQLISPGESVEFQITIENWAVDYDTVSLEMFDRPSGWDLAFNDTFDPTSLPFNVDPYGERVFHPVVFTPRNAVAGKHMVVLRASGRANTTDIRLMVEVARKDSFQLFTMTSSGTDDTYRLTLGDNLIPIRVVNRGNYYDSVTMEIDTRPDWAPLTFHSIEVGGGTNVTTLSGAAPVNISGIIDSTIMILEDPLSKITLTFDPGQSAVVYLGTSIPLGTRANSGVVGIKYMYGVFREQQFLQASIKLILADIEIVDTDGDGGPDIDIYPEPDYEIGDRIYFSWTLRNNYPYETSGLKWSVELSGRVIIEGDVPPIGPGEEMEFNESWKADKSTKYHHVVTLKISGDAYPQEDKAPSASTSEQIYISPGPRKVAWGVMILFVGIMLLIISAFIAFYLWVRKDLREKEAVERERYEALYGRKGAPPLKSGASAGRYGRRALEKGERRELPPSHIRHEGERKRGKVPAERGRKGKGPDREKASGGARKASPLSGEGKAGAKGRKMKVKDPSASGEKHIGRKKKRTAGRESAPGSDEVEELEELEEFEET